MGHDNLSKRYQVRVTAVSCRVTMKQSRWRAKNKAPARLPSPKAGSAGSPIDFVSVAGSDRVPQCLISWYDFTLIDFGDRLRSSPGCRSQLIKLSELAVDFYFFIDLRNSPAVMIGSLLSLKSAWFLVIINSCSFSIAV